MRNIILFCLIAVFALSASAVADDPKFDITTVYVDEVTAKPGEHFAVKVNVFNTDSLGGCQVPIFFRHEEIDLWCDSISFAGSRMEYFAFDDVKLPETEKDDKVAYFAFIATIDPDVYIDALPPGDGLLATLYFTAPKESPKGTVELKRGMIPHPHISFIFYLWDGMGNEVDSEFKGSTITIK